MLSHLFLQAANSCELLRRSPEAVERLTDLITDSGAETATVREILDARRTAFRERTARRIGSLGFRPAFATIGAPGGRSSKRH